MPARVDFSDWSGPVKNPSAGGEVSAVPIKVQRIDVVGGSNITSRQINAMVEVIQANKVIGPAIAAEVRAGIPLVYDSFERGYANLRAIAKTHTPAEAVLRRVQEILTEKMARPATV
jgi:hypothetical protein